MNVKQISASVFFLLYLALAPFTTHAGGVDGASGKRDIIEDIEWDKLESVTVTASLGRNQFCMVVCSAEAQSPAQTGATMQYHLAVTIDQIVLGGSDRKFEFEANPTPIRDVSYIEISTTAAFALAPDLERTISCSAKKDDVSNPDLTIENSSMSITCADTELNPNPKLVVY
jgi:hypothetical protein